MTPGPLPPPTGSTVERPFWLPVETYRKFTSQLLNDTLLLDHLVGTDHAEGGSFTAPWRQLWAAQLRQCEGETAVSPRGRCTIFLLPNVTMQLESLAREHAPLDGPLPPSSIKGLYDQQAVWQAALSCGAPPTSPHV